MNPSGFDRRGAG